MKSLSEIDTNLKVESSIKKDDIKFFDANDPMFKIYGVIYENGKYRRMPEKVASSVSEGVFALHAHCAGGRIRFRTDSPYVAISVENNGIEYSSNFSFTGKCGMDIYMNEDGKDIHVGTYAIPEGTTNKYEGVAELGVSKLRDITINMSSYSEVHKLFIGLKEDSIVEECTPYACDKPVVYYGSSITQGAFSSRPGNTYQAIVSRRLNLDYINLGFSGNALAEDEMIDYINNFDMCAFVYDYDHNAPTPEYLKETHEKMFKAIREKHPDLPIIMMPRPRFELCPHEKKRLEIITETYNNAVNSGDKNVYLIDNKTLCALCGNDGTVDLCHPNDAGFMSMAKAVGDVMEKILKNT
jgi:hypothetical protein